METYITMCKIGSQWEFALWLRKLKQGLCIKLQACDREGGSRKVLWVFQEMPFQAGCPPVSTLSMVPVRLDVRPGISSWNGGAEGRAGPCVQQVGTNGRGRRSYPQDIPSPL